MMSAWLGATPGMQAVLLSCRSLRESLAILLGLRCSAGLHACCWQGVNRCMLAPDPSRLSIELEFSHCTAVVKLATRAGTAVSCMPGRITELAVPTSAVSVTATTSV